MSKNKNQSVSDWLQEMSEGASKQNAAAFEQAQAIISEEHQKKMISIALDIYKTIQTQLEALKENRRREEAIKAELARLNQYAEDLKSGKIDLSSIQVESAVSLSELLRKKLEKGYGGTVSVNVRRSNSY